LKAIAPELSGMLCDDLGAVSETADVLVVTHKSDANGELISTRPDIPVVDLVRINRGSTAHPNLEGIGW